MSKRTTALQPINETGVALRLIQGIIDDILARMLMDSYRGKSKKRPRRKADAARRINKWVLCQPGTNNAPFITNVKWTGPLRGMGWRAVLVRNDSGEPILKDDKPTFKYVRHQDFELEGLAELPDPRSKRRKKAREITSVRALVIGDGKGFVLPYGSFRKVGGKMKLVGAEDGMPCFFVQLHHLKTGEPILNRDGNPVFKAVPLGLGNLGDISTYNMLLEKRREQHGKDVSDMLVSPMAHGLRGSQKLLKLVPTGRPDFLDGQISVARKPNKNQWHDRIFGTVFGKKVRRLHREVDLIPNDNGDGYSAQLMEVRETWQDFKVVSVLSLWGKGLAGRSGERKLDALEIDAAAALGLTLYKGSPRASRKIVARALNAKVDKNNTLVAYLCSQGMTRPDMETSEVSRIMAGIRHILEDATNRYYENALHDLMRALGGGAAGTESHGMPRINEILDDLTPEDLLEAYNRQDGDCPLAEFIVGSPTAKRLGMEEWDWGCWVLRTCRKKLLKELARSQADGLKLPKKKKEAKASSRSGGNRKILTGEVNTNGASSAAVLWHPNMRVAKLREVARDNGVEGVKSKTTKPKVIEALKGVCPPTDSANPKAAASS